MRNGNLYHRPHELWRNIVVPQNVLMQLMLKNTTKRTAFFTFLKMSSKNYDKQKERLMSKYLLIMEFRFGAILCSLSNEKSDVGHIKQSCGPQVAHPWYRLKQWLSPEYGEKYRFCHSFKSGWVGRYQRSIDAVEIYSTNWSSYNTIIGKVYIAVLSKFDDQPQSLWFVRKRISGGNDCFVKFKNRFNVKTAPSSSFS